MNKRKPIQFQHEQSFVNRFIEWLYENTGEQFEVLDHPNPPEAIICSDRRTTWIEVTDASFSDEYAQDLYSAVTPGEIYKPMRETFQKDIDIKFAKRFADVLAKKLSKDSYDDCVKKYGPGYLIMGMQSPWFDEASIIYIRRECEARNFKNRGSFNKIFIEYCSKGENIFKEWHL